MSAFDRQGEIADEIAEFALIASNGEFDELLLEVEVEDSWVKSHCEQVRNGEVEQLSLRGIRDPNLMKLSFELRKEMLNHTGGDLKKYTFRIDKEGRASIDFEYRNRRSE